MGQGGMRVGSGSTRRVEIDEKVLHECIHKVALQSGAPILTDVPLHTGTRGRTSSSSTKVAALTMIPFSLHVTHSVLVLLDVRYLPPTAVAAVLGW